MVFFSWKDSWVPCSFSFLGWQQGMLGLHLQVDQWLLNSAYWSSLLPQVNSLFFWKGMGVIFLFCYCFRRGKNLHYCLWGKYWYMHFSAGPKLEEEQGYTLNTRVEMGRAVKKNLVHCLVQKTNNKISVMMPRNWIVQSKDRCILKFYTVCFEQELFFSCNF